jgi:hypothetical protein
MFAATGLMLDAVIRIVSAVKFRIQSSSKWQVDLLLAIAKLVIQQMLIVTVACAKALRIQFVIGSKFDSRAWI